MFQTSAIITKQSYVIKNLKMPAFDLPNEIWCKIFSYLPFEPKKNATATCKLWFRLIREDPKISGYILISCYNMEQALNTFEWDWSNWPALKTLELINLEPVEDSRESIQNVVGKLSLKVQCPPSVEAVLFYVDLTPMQTNGQSILKYELKTNEIIGLGQKLDSIQKWNEYESNMKALKRLKCIMAGKRYWMGVQLPPRILRELKATPNNLPLLIASPDFQTFRRLCDRLTFNQSDQSFYMQLDVYLDEMSSGEE